MLIAVLAGPSRLVGPTDLVVIDELRLRAGSGEGAGSGDVQEVAPLEVYRYSLAKRPHHSVAAQGADGLPSGDYGGHMTEEEEEAGRRRSGSS